MRQLQWSRSRLVAVLCIATTIGFVAGRYTVEQRTPPSATPRPPAHAPAALLASGATSAQAMDRAPSETATDPGTVETTRELRTLTKLAGQLTTSVRVQLFSRFDRLHPDAVALLGLDAAQAKALDAALNMARSQLDSLSSSHAQITASAEAISIHTPALEGGPAIYDGLMDSFEKVLGREKSGAFVTLLGDQLSDAFSQFGAEERTITIARTLPGYATFHDDAYYLKEVTTRAGRTTDTSSWRFWGGRIEFLPAKVQWAANLVAQHLDKAQPTKIPEE